MLNLLRPVTEDREDEGVDDTEGEDEDTGQERLEPTRADSVSSSSHNEPMGRGRWLKKMIGIILEPMMMHQVLDPGGPGQQPGGRVGQAGQQKEGQQNQAGGGCPRGLPSHLSLHTEEQHPGGETGGRQTEQSCLGRKARLSHSGVQRYNMEI